MQVVNPQPASISAGRADGAEVSSRRAGVRRGASTDPGPFIQPGVNMPESKQTKSINRTSEAELRALAAEGLNWGQVSERLGIQIHKIKIAAQVLGINSGRGYHRLAIEHDQVRARLERGESLKGIAESEGICRSTLQIALKKAGFPTTVAAAIKAKLAREEA